MVATLGLLELVQMRFEIFLLPERRRVDALEHLPVLVAAPVRSRRVQKLEVLEVSRCRERAGRDRGR